MSSQELESFINIFKTHNIILYILLISSGVIAFDFLGLRKILGIGEVGQPYLAVIGIIFTLSFAGFVLATINSLVGGLSGKIRNYLEDRKFKKELSSLIENLTDKEVVVLSLYIIEGANTIWLPVQAPEVTSLVSRKLIYMSSKYCQKMTNGMIVCHYSIEQDVKEKFELYLEAKFEEPWQDNFDKFFAENKPEYFQPLSNTKAMWQFF